MNQNTRDVHRENGAGCQDFLDHVRHGHPPFAGSCASEVDAPRCVCYCGDSRKSFHVKSVGCVVRGNAMSGTLELMCSMMLLTLA